MKYRLTFQSFVMSFMIVMLGLILSQSSMVSGGSVEIDLTRIVDVDSRNIAVSSNGTMYLAYFYFNDVGPPGTGEVRYTISTDDGISWSEDTLIYIDETSSSTLRQVAMCIDVNDNLHFVWEWYDGANKNCLHRTWWVGNSTWSDVSADLRGPLTGDWQMVFPDASGNVYLVMGAEPDVNERDIESRTWDGDSWGPRVTIHESTGSDAHRPEGATSPNGTLNVVYQAGSGPEIYHSISIDQGVSWSTGVQIDDNLGGAWAPSIAIEMNGDIHVAWQGKNATHADTQAVVRSYDASGGTWGPVIYLTDVSADKHRHVTTSTDLSGSVYVLWCDNELSASYRIAVRESTDGGVTWDPEEQLLDDTFSSGSPQLLHFVFPADVGNVPLRGFIFSYTEYLGGEEMIVIYWSDDYELVQPPDPPGSPPPASIPTETKYAVVDIIIWGFVLAMIIAVMTFIVVGLKGS